MLVVHVAAAGGNKLPWISVVPANFFLHVILKTDKGNGQDGGRF